MEGGREEGWRGREGDSGKGLGRVGVRGGGEVRGRDWEGSLVFNFQYVEAGLVCDRTGVRQDKV